MIFFQQHDGYKYLTTHMMDDVLYVTCYGKIPTMYSDAVEMLAHLPMIRPLRLSGITFTSNTLQTSWHIFFVIACAAGYHITRSCVPLGHSLWNQFIEF
jgi:hypothetical protein